MVLGSEMFVVDEFMLWLERWDDVLLSFWIDFRDSFIKNGELCGMCVRLSFLIRLERRTWFGGSSLYEAMMGSLLTLFSTTLSDGSSPWSPLPLSMLLLSFLLLSIHIFSLKIYLSMSPEFYKC
jgi:hypothetical protein